MSDGFNISYSSRKFGKNIGREPLDNTLGTPTAEAGTSEEVFIRSKATAQSNLPTAKSMV